MRGQNHRWRGQIRVAAVLAAGAVLLGCAGSSLPTLGIGLPNWFRSSNPAAQATGPTVRALDEDCPTMDIRTGAGTLAVAAKSQLPTANDLRYQLTFAEIARQCFVDGGIVRIRAGVQGRVVIGPAGAPPQVNVPIRYAVVQEGVSPKTIVTKLRRFPVSIPPGNANVEFTDIEEDLSFPMPPVHELAAYVVYVGFDDVAEPRPGTKRPGPKRKAPRR
jgi:hypothetical protein